MGQLILRKSDGTETTIREDIRDSTELFDVIVRDECLAVKAWHDEDVQTALKEQGYEGTIEQAYAVINHCDCDALCDCTDGEWQIIFDAIEFAKDELTDLQTQQ